ncbi:MAG TPA: methyltransferase domain-containing protein [Gammaproteobacteria bacterium]
MDIHKRRQYVQKTFDTVADVYDHPALSWFDQTAKIIIQAADIQQNQRVLDIACGTGKVTTELARHQHQPRVTAVDLSSGMLSQAKRKAEQHQLDNIDFQQMAFEDMAFGETFDIAVCSFGIFFVNEMEAALAQFARQVKPGGRIILSTFAEGSFSPFSDAFMRLYGEFGFDVPIPGWLRLCSNAHINQLFADAGLNQPQCRQYDFGYEISSTDQWWDIVWNAGYRGMIESLDDEQKEAFRKQHLAEVAELIENNQNYLKVDVIVSTGQKA